MGPVNSARDLQKKKQTTFFSFSSQSKPSLRKKTYGILSQLHSIRFVNLIGKKKSSNWVKIKCAFDIGLKNQFFLLFNLFLLLFMDSIALFDTIRRFHGTISITF